MNEVGKVLPLIIDDDVKRGRLKVRERRGFDFSLSFFFEHQRLDLFLFFGVLFCLYISLVEVSETLFPLSLQFLFFSVFALFLWALNGACWWPVKWRLSWKRWVKCFIFFGFFEFYSSFFPYKKRKACKILSLYSIIWFWAGFCQFLSLFFK